MKKKEFNFEDGLAVGKRGEEDFHKRYPEYFKSTERDYDFITAHGLKIELKTDYTTYGNDPEGNLFLELYGDKNRKDFASIWKCKNKKVGIFVYVCAVEQKEYWFVNVPALVTHVEKWMKYEVQKQVFNHNKYSGKVSHITIGYAVPKAEIAHLARIVSF